MCKMIKLIITIFFFVKMVDLTISSCCHFANKTRYQYSHTLLHIIQILLLQKYCINARFVMYNLLHILVYYIYFLLLRSPYIWQANIHNIVILLHTAILTSIEIATLTSVDMATLTSIDTAYLTSIDTVPWSANEVPSPHEQGKEDTPLHVAFQSDILKCSSCSHTDRARRKFDRGG